MTTVLRPVGYTGSRQQLTWPNYWGTQVTAYLWGAGGGGGGGDGGNSGGNGTGGGYASVSFNVAVGDVIDVAVGGPGGGGQGNRSTGAGGSAGASLTGQTAWTTLNAVPSPSTIRVSNRAYCPFLNQYGIWNDNIWDVLFDRTFTINFASTGYYTFTSSADNSAAIFVDGVEILSVRGYQSTYNTTISVSAGNHSVRILSYNEVYSPGAVALTIDGGLNSYSGGGGGAAGPSGSSGGGGGSGGATVVRVNGVVLAVAGGGGGGGGAGYRGGGPGNAPGPNGQSGGESAGQNGGNHPGDGGGGGAGGGGFRGGNGGYWGGGPSSYSDTYGQGGSFGSSDGWSIANPSEITPGGSNTEYYGGNSTGGRGSANNGVQGAAGRAVFAFDASGIQVVNANDWRPAKQVYVKNSGVWQAAQAVYVKYNGTWQPVIGSIPLNFESVSGSFGVFARNGPAYTPPDPMGMGMGGPMFDIF